MSPVKSLSAAEIVQAHFDAMPILGADFGPVVLELGFQDTLGIHSQPPVDRFPPSRTTTIHLHGDDAFILPGDDAHRSPCSMCFHRRWQAIRQQDERDSLELAGDSCVVPSLPWLTPLVLAALHTLASGATADTSEDGRTTVRRIKLDTLQTSSIPLVADPDCPACSTSPDPATELSTLGRTPRAKIAPDVFRSVGLSEYPIEIDAVANPVCGILGPSAHAAFDNTTTMPVTGYSYVRGLLYLYEFFWSGHANSIAESRILAVLEGLERYAGLLSRGLPAPEWATLEELHEAGRLALDPRNCTLYPAKFYEDNAPYFTEFTPSLSIPWVLGRNLVKDRTELVPQRLVHYLDQAGPAFVDECSNGCATGGSPEEAVFHGLMELIERDSFLLTWFARFPAPEIDPRSSGAKDIDLMVARMAREGYEVRMFDTRVDISVPVVTGVAVRTDGKPGKLCYAAGASMDPIQAIRAALCEIASYVPSFGHRMEAGYDEARCMEEDFGLVRELKHHALLHGLDSMAPYSDFLLGTRRARPVDEVYADWGLRRPRHIDLSEDLRWLVKLLAERGFDVYAVDQTTPEQRSLGLSTFATIVPGLVPIDFGWYKQRAFYMDRVLTAHRSAGLRKYDLSAADLNPVPHPFP